MPRPSGTSSYSTSLVFAQDVLAHDAELHEALDHDALDHEALDHEALDQDALDHEALDHEALDHEALDQDAAFQEGSYYAVNIGLLTTAIALETTERWRDTFRARFAWLFPHYLVYGVVVGMVAVAYDVAGVLALFVFAVPLILVRKAQLDYINHTEESVRRLREAAETIERQNESLRRANQLLRDRATEAMESLAAVVDARDTYTAGHSRRVQGIAVAIGRELALDGPELESLSFAALFSRHRQGCRAGRRPIEIRTARRHRVVDRARTFGGGRADHRPPRLPCRRDARDQTSP